MTLIPEISLSLNYIYYISFYSINFKFINISLKNLSYKYTEDKNSQTYYCCWYIYKNI